VKYVVYPQDNNTLAVDEYVTAGKKEKEFSYPSGERKAALISNKEAEAAFVKMLEDLGPDIVHFQHLLGLPLNLIRIAKEHSVKTVITVHDGYFLCPDSGLLEMGEKYCDGCTDFNRCDLCLQARYGIQRGFQQKWREACRAMLESADILIVPSRYQRDLYARTLGIDKKRMIVIEHSVPAHQTTATYDLRDFTTIRAGFVGHVVDKAKGRDVILQLLNDNRDENIEWHFFGEGSDISDHFQGANIRPRDKLFFHGYYEEGKLPSTLANANITVVVIPTIQFESHGYVLTEAWQAGIPVIATDIAAIGQRIRENGGGWVYPLGSDTSTILELISKIRSDPTGYYSKLQEIRATKHATFTEYIERYKEIYSELISGLEKPDLASYAKLLNLSKPRFQKLTV
jgi:glycosyltransferase involved in cell wall biosynthesis